MKTLTELIMESTTPFDNPFQGNDKKVVFVCSAGLLRSATAARIYARKYNTRAAGSAPYALVPLSTNLIVWADEIVFVNKENYQEVLKTVNLDGKVIKVLDIPDEYEHMHPKLIQYFQEQYEKL